MRHLFQIFPSSGVPIYRQIIDQVRRMIASGHLEAGEGLPSVRTLALQLEVNPMTISKAYSLLEAEGLLERRRGRGMIVARNQEETRPLEERLRLLDPAIRETITRARQLEIDRDRVVARLDHLWGES